jgi:glycosyltransferase involved in cell wall biosynthesis
MASVLAALESSTLPRRVNLTLFETGKVTSSDRPFWRGVSTRLKLMSNWWKLYGKTPRPIAHIHTCSGFTFFLDAILLIMCWLRGAPTILHIHGAKFDIFLSSLSPLSAAFARWISRRASVVVVLSTEWQHKLTPFWPDAAFKVVANGVTMAMHAKNVGRLTQPRFVFMGNLGQRKGVHVLLQAAQLSRAAWCLDLAGGEEDPGYMQTTRAEIERLGLGERVQLLGPVVGKAKEDLLQNAQGFVLPSLAEGLPMALLEAMAIGLPPVVSAVGAMPGVVRQGIDGLVVPANDAVALAAALDQLALEPVFRVSLGLCAADRCRDLYGVEHMVGRLADIYANLSSTRP